MNTASLLALVLGTVIPAVTALITKAHLALRLRALLSAMLAAIASGLSGAYLSPPHGVGQWEQIVWTILLAWVAAAAAYVTGSPQQVVTQAVDRIAPNVGFGPKAPPEAPPAVAA